MTMYESERCLLITFFRLILYCTMFGKHERKVEGKKKNEEMLFFLYCLVCKKNENKDLMKF